jgi:hypothetical protein
LLKTHGNCVIRAKKQLKKRVQKQVHIVKLQVGWDSDSGEILLPMLYENTFIVPFDEEAALLMPSEY